MHTRRKFIALAIGLLGLATTSANGALDFDPDDMHWPTKPASKAMVEIVDSAPYQIGHNDDMHW